MVFRTIFSMYLLLIFTAMINSVLEIPIYFLYWNFGEKNQFSFSFSWVFMSHSIEHNFITHGGYIWEENNSRGFKPQVFLPLCRKKKHFWWFCHWVFCCLVVLKGGSCWVVVFLKQLEHSLLPSLSYSGLKRENSAINNVCISGCKITHKG